MVATYQRAITKQREVAKGLTKTNQGGDAYLIDAWKQFRRFLILGTEGNTYYETSEKRTDFNIASVQAVLAEDGLKAIDMIVEVSDKGLAFKNDPAILALALAASYTDEDRPQYQEAIRQYALAESVYPKVCRTSTHHFHFVDYVSKLRGWGSGLRKGVGRWYTGKTDMALAQQVTKYVQRDGWSHADVLRKAHPIAQSDVQNQIFKYVVDGDVPAQPFESYPPTSRNDALDYIVAVEEAKSCNDENGLIALIERYNLPREVLPTLALNSPRVWEALLYAGKGMPMTALLRNLATMTKIGLLSQGSDAARFVMDRIENEQNLKYARIHPIDVIKAKLTYQAGHGMRSDATWTPLQPIVDSLETAFYASFGSVTPTNKRLQMALDVSGSMTFGEREMPNSFSRLHGSYYYKSNFGGDNSLAGIPGFSPRIAATVLAMVNIRVERDVEIVGFTDQLVDLGISRHDSLEAAMEKTHRSDFGATNCALPMELAALAGKQFDAFCVYTDNETGYQNPSEALRRYRSKSGIHDAKLVVNGMTATKFSIADPTDPNMLDVVGFDASAPHVMSAFIRGEI